MAGKFKPQNDKNFADLAYAVADKIVKDFAGLPIDGEHHQIMTNQLMKRIARALRAFHHREGHLEDY